MSTDILKKSAVRQRLIQQRSAIPLEEQTRANHVIQKQVLKLWDEAWKTVLMYVNQPAEVSTTPLILELLRKGVRLCVPAFDRSLNRYYPSELQDFETEMETGGFGILEPKAAARRPVPIGDLDVVFLPCVAVDRTGNRMGYGYGHFDRIGQPSRAVKVGLAFHFQLVDSLTPHEGGIPLDLVITEKEVIRCPKR